MVTPIRWGILGAGRVAAGFADGLAVLDDAELVAIASRSAANAERFAQHHRVPRVHATYAGLVADPQIDAVYIGTPHHRHAADSLLCLEQGKAVVCEKPFTVNARESKAVIDTARARGVFCMEAMWMRFIPAVRKVHELVAERRIGEVRMIQADFCMADEFDPSTRFFDPALGGGALLDRGVYPLSLAVSLLGRPSSITGQATLAPTGVDDQSALVLSFDGGRLAVVAASLSSIGRNEALILGTEGAIRIHAPMWCPSRLTVQPFRPTPAHADGAGAGTSRLVDAMKSNPVTHRAARLAKQAVLRVRGRGPRTLRLPITGSGYNYEAAEAMRCMRAGLLESPLMPLDESQMIMELMDEVRLGWGVRYPADDVPVRSDRSEDIGTCGGC